MSTERKRKETGAAEARGASSASRRSGRKGLSLAIALLLAADLFVVTVTPLEAEAIHEWTGLAAIVLVVAHLVMNHRWFASLFRGKYSFRRSVLTVIDLGMLACILGLAVSSIIISKVAFGFLPMIPGASWARVVHLLCSNWLFVLAFLHAGMHARFLKSGTVAYIATAVLAVAGIVSLVMLGIPQYLVLSTQFFGYMQPFGPTVALYALAALGLACLGWLLVHAPKVRKQK